MSVLDGFDLLGDLGGGGEGQGAPPPYRLGTIAAGVGGVCVQIDGEDVAGAKNYKYLKSYTPTVGDRVLLVAVGGSYIILGAY